MRAATAAAAAAADVVSCIARAQRRMENLQITIVRESANAAIKIRLTRHLQS
jgi:hypothetical protein